MSDARIDCPVCDGLGYLLCDDGSEIQCTYCDGTGKVTDGTGIVPVVETETEA
jgi:hypothetical protein